MNIKDLSIFEYKMPLSEFKSVTDTVQKATMALEKKLKEEGYTIPYSNPEIEFYKLSFVPSQGEIWEKEEIRVRIEFFSWADTSDKVDSFRI